MQIEARCRVMRGRGVPLAVVALLCGAIGCDDGEGSTAAVTDSAMPADGMSPERDAAGTERDAAGTERDADVPGRDAAQAEPDAAQAEPDAAQAEPDAALTESDAAQAEPDAAQAEPDAALTESDAGLAEPDAALAEPDAALAEPDAALAEPDAAVAEPDAALAEPDAAPDAAVPEPDAALPVAHPLSDEFDGPPADLLAGDDAGWSVLHPDRAAAVTIADGEMVIVAENPPPGQNWAWFEDFYAVLVYREIEGDFAVTARLSVVDDDNPAQQPSGDFNAGGFVIRAPGGTHSRDERWVMYNFGRQGPTGYSREIKKTRDSQSGLYLNPQPFEEDVLLVCRIGDVLRFWTWDQGAWIPERFEPGVTANQARAWPEIDESGRAPMRFDLALPDRVQVGIMAGAWTTAGPADQSRTRATFEYVRFAPSAPEQFEDCPAAFPAP